MSSGTGVDAARENLRKVMLQSSDALGRATSGARVLPDLLVCGGQRCGTTSMYKALVQQPTIFRPVWRKGVHYFDVGYDHDLSWYRSHFPLEAQLNRAAKRHGTRALSFESSPYYLFHPLAADRIAADLPEVKLIVLVRDPVERAYSAHAHEFARGFETLGFEAALDAEAERIDGEAERLRNDPAYRSHAHRHQAYRSRGEYATQLERIVGLFGRDRIKVVDSHRFFSEPESEYAEVMSWLGVVPSVDTVFEKHNARPRPEMDDSLRTQLEQHFEPHDRALETWLGKVPSWRV
ncbi:MAG: sulfotransferase domain-containing protein [Marmoricola sp.]